MSWEPSREQLLAFLTSSQGQVSTCKVQASAGQAVRGNSQIRATRDFGFEEARPGRRAAGSGPATLLPSSFGWFLLQRPRE